MEPLNTSLETLDAMVALVAHVDGASTERLTHCQIARASKPAALAPRAAKLPAVVELRLAEARDAVSVANKEDLAWLAQKEAAGRR